MNNIDGTGVPKNIVCGGTFYDSLFTKGNVTPCFNLDSRDKYSCSKQFERSSKPLGDSSLKCPKGYRPANSWGTLKGFIPESQPKNYTGNNYIGQIRLKEACPRRNGKFMQVCEPDYFEGDEKAKCYFGEISKGELSKIPLLGTVINFTNLSRCPPDSKDPASAKKFLRNYCSKPENIDKSSCNNFWNASSGSELQNRDNAYINICKTKEYKDDPRCSCINAVSPEGVPSAVAWIFNNDCGNPKINAWHTRNMQNVTFQDCRQYWNVADSDHTIAKNNTMEQHCSMNFPESRTTTGRNTPESQSQQPPTTHFNPDDNDSPGPPQFNPTDHPSNNRTNIIPDDGGNIAPQHHTISIPDIDDDNNDIVSQDNILGIPLLYIVLFFIFILLISLYMINDTRKIEKVNKQNII